VGSLLLSHFSAMASRQKGAIFRDALKKITKPMMGFKAFHSATAAIDGIETAHRIQKGQLSEENMPAYKQSMALAGQFYPPISATSRL
jgi:hypothetical protein